MKTFHFSNAWKMYHVLRGGGKRRIQSQSSHTSCKKHVRQQNKDRRNTTKCISIPLERNTMLGDSTAACISLFLMTDQSYTVPTEKQAIISKEVGFVQVGVPSSGDCGFEAAGIALPLDSYMLDPS
jgi:hypothetical protein